MTVNVCTLQNLCVQVKRMMKNGTGELGIVDRFAAGSMAGVFSQTAIYPLEVCYLLIYCLSVNDWARERY